MRRESVGAAASTGTHIGGAAKGKVKRATLATGEAPMTVPYGVDTLKGEPPLRSTMGAASTEQTRSN